jgi:2-polyprenyl-3-methyl-5-hydroxy-6-metoxy-1,4-benzoquinol methylase
MNLKIIAKTIDVEHVNCGFCGSEAYKTLYPAPEESIYSQCAVVQCNKCGLVRTSPRPTQTALAETYANEYYSYQEPDLKGWSNQIKILAMKLRLPALYPYVIPLPILKDASICDVGCGAGQWLGLMRAAYPGVKLSGFEIDPNTASIAAQVAQADVRHGDFLETGWADNSFDFITFWDVLEHVTNPQAVMQEVVRLLKPGGVVVVISPNVDCSYSKIFNQFWWALLYDQHLYHFSRKTLTKLFQACNLEPVYSAIPPTLPHPHWNIINVLKEMEHKGLRKTGKYFLLSNLARAIAPFDKLQLTRILPQHLIMCAKKPTS